MPDQGERCTLPTDDATVRNIINHAKTVAVVGISADPTKPSHDVAAALQAAGYDIIPVNPRYDEVLGQPCYPSLDAIGRPVDVVDVFRNSDAALEVTRQAIAAGARAVWLQVGVVNETAKHEAEAAGLDFVQDRCMKIEVMAAKRDK